MFHIRKIIATVVLAALTTAAAPAAVAVAEGPAKRTASLTGTKGVQALLAEGPFCEPNLARFLTPNASGRGTVRIAYGGSVNCNFILAGYGQSFLIDRTNGATNNGGVLSYGSEFSFNEGNRGSSTGSHAIDGKVEDGGRQVEVGLYLELTTLDGIPWGPCGELPLGVRYLSLCEGVGTDTLMVTLGSSTFSTGLGPFASLPVPRNALGRSAYAERHHSYPAADLPVGTGTSVFAIKAGTVTRLANGGCGTGIRVNGFDGGSYLYCHLSAQTAANGAVVLAGEQLGRSGNTGRVTGPHLHVEIEANGQQRCPQSMLLNIFDGLRPPLPQNLPTTGCVSRTLRIRMDKSSYRAGESPLYTVTGAKSFTPIYWSSTLNGVSTGEIEAFYGHFADADGNWSGYGGPWSNANAGAWTKTIVIDDGVEATAAFTTVKAVTLTMDRTTYAVGQVPLYTVTGAPPNSPIYWSSSRNGVSTGEVDAFYGHYTDASGNFSAYGGVWSDSNVGTWTKTVKIGGQISTFRFSVIVSP